MNSGNRPQLPLASSGCSCCAPAAAKPAASLPTTTQHEAPAAVAHADAARPRDFAVEGMTCGHCVRSVEAAVSALPGVSSASVHLVPGGRSRLTVAGTASDADVSQAVTAAGYALA
jgi:copper chaperone CopZ